MILDMILPELKNYSPCKKKRKSTMHAYFYYCFCVGIPHRKYDQRHLLSMLSFEKFSELFVHIIDANMSSPS